MLILTGGAGFIGSAFLAKLNAHSISDVIVVDALGTCEKWKNLVGKQFADYIHKDRFLPLLTGGNFGAPKMIIHLGACTSTLEQDADYLLDNNYRYSRAIAQWAIQNKIPMIYASSAATYGDGSLGFSDEDDCTAKYRPLNSYGFSKHLFDLWALSSGALSQITGLKFFNVFGPNEYHKGEMASVVFKAFHEIQASGSLKLFRSYKTSYLDGEQQRDFLYIKDCVEALWWLIEHPNVKGLYNLGSGRARTWNHLARALFLALNKKPNVQYIDMPEQLRDRYQYFTQANMTKLQKAGYCASFTSLEDAVGDYVHHYLQEGLRYL